MSGVLVAALVILAAAAVGARWIRRAAAEGEVGCSCWFFEPEADFDRWAAELDADDSEPPVVEPTPVSDEHLLDVWHSTRDPEVAR